MLINIAIDDWVNPNDVSAIERFTDGTIIVHLRSGNKFRYDRGSTADMAKRVNDACAKLYDIGNA